MRRRNSAMFLACSILASIAFWGCASEDIKTKQQDETQKAVQSIQSRLDTLEAKMNMLSQKFDSTRSSLDQLLKAQATPDVPTLDHPSEAAGTDVTVTPSKNDPEGAFVNDAAVQSYRKALIQFKAGEYPQSSLAFSGFVEKYPDHPLAGSAQYYAGESYMKQREYALAVREFQRVLTSYDRSSHVADTLREIADAEDALKKTEDAARHRQLLISLFAQSPAAAPEQPQQESAPAPTAPSAAPVPASSGTQSSLAPPATARMDDPPPPTAPVVTPQDANAEKQTPLIDSVPNISSGEIQTTE